eukprot:s2628_g9.t1
MSQVLRLLVALSRLTGPVESLLWPWNGGYVANSCLGSDNGQRWKEIHQRMMFLLEAAHEPGTRFQAYHKRVSTLDEARREAFMEAWEDVTNFTAEISFATEDHPVAHDCWCGVGASIVFQTLPQWPTQVLKASAGKSRTFYPPLEICMVMSLWGETCGVWPLNLLLYRVAEHFEPFVRQCSLPVELVNRAPGTIAYGLLKKLSTYEEHNAVVDLCVGQALPAALLASKSATVEYVERFTFMILWWSACRRPTPFKNSVYSFMAGRYDVMRTLAFRPETPFQVWEKAESGLLSNYSTALRRDQQNQLLDLMDVAHSVCEMLGIAYVLNGGGLLGSMRHLSIIPWDDDAEMAIVEEDDRGVEILLLALAMRLESRLELAKLDVASLVEASDWSEEESNSNGQTSMLLDRLEAVERTADFLSRRGVALHIQAKKARTFRISHAAAGDPLWSYPNFDFYICSRENATHWRGYSRRSGPLYSDSMIFPRRKRYWKRPDSTDGLVLWTFNEPSEYLELLYGANWFTECLREEGHADEANRRLAPWNGEDPYVRIPCAEVAAVVQYMNVSEDQWAAIYGAVTAELGNGWQCQHLVSNPPEAVGELVLATARCSRRSVSCEGLVTLTSGARLQSLVCYGDHQNKSWAWEDRYLPQVAAGPAWVPWEGSRESFHLVIVGGGPAGLGPLYYAASVGELEVLLRKGVVILEKEDHLGAGPSFELPISSNSFGSAFVDILNSENVARLFPETLRSPLVQELNVSKEVELKKVGAFLRLMAQELQQIFRGFPASQVVLGASVLDLHVSDLTQTVVYEQAGSKERLQGERVILTMGATEDLQHCQQAPLGKSRLTLSHCGFKHLFSGYDALQFSATHDDLVIVGSSHTAWAILHLLRARRSPTNVTLVQRTAPKYFFYSAAEAQSANASFDSFRDVCPITGRINRFSGLRGDIRDYAVTRGLRRQPTDPFVRYFTDGRDEFSSSELCGLLSRSPVICATGYRPRFPRIFLGGKQVEVAYASSPTRRGQLVTEAGILEHTYAYGLGSGIALNADIGGEVRGWGSVRADGIWLYQFDIGKAIHRELTKVGGSASWVEIYNKKARELSAGNAPLHHFGGYEMFTWEQWLAQAQVLLEPLRPSLRRSVLEVGVGAGAFVAAIRAFTDENPDTVVYGIDPAVDTIAVARQRVNGTFVVAGVSDLKMLFKSRSFACVVSFGVITYLDSEEGVAALFGEMLRIAQDFVYVGEVSDLSKKQLAEHLRASSHVNSTSQQRHVSRSSPPHLYVSKDLFHRVAAEHGVTADIKDHTDLGLTYPTAPYRFSVYVDIRKLSVAVSPDISWRSWRTKREHLIHGDQRERLKQAWLVHELQPEGTTTGEGLLSVLQVFMAHYVYVSQKVDSGYALTLPKALEEVNTISRIYGGWPQIRSFIHDQVDKALLKSKSLTFEDAAEAADMVLLLFQEVSGAMCHDMERTFQTLRGGDHGRVLLSELRTADGGDLFRESLDYLRQLGALEETGRETFVFMPNYMLGPSNCDGTTSFYDLCCPNSCEVYKDKLEQALTSAPDHVDAIARVVEEHSGNKLQEDLLAKLKVMAKEPTSGFRPSIANVKTDEQGERVLIHGHAFADWLHQALPRECPRPRAADFKGMAGAIPDSKMEFQATTGLKEDLFECDKNAGFSGFHVCRMETQASMLAPLTLHFTSRLCTRPPERGCGHGSKPTSSHRSVV